MRQEENTVKLNKTKVTLYVGDTVKETKNVDKKIVIRAGNEKYCYLSESLPTKSEKPSDIQKGDLMLYGSDCLVLFYESFLTSYSYTLLGKLDDPAGLEKALGSGEVCVTFAYQ
jgi:hypothetical protein